MTVRSLSLWERVGEGLRSLVNSSAPSPGSLSRSDLSPPGRGGCAARIPIQPKLTSARPLTSLIRGSANLRLIARERNGERPDRRSRQQDHRQHRHPGNQEREQPVLQEIAGRERRKAGNAGRDQRRQSGLDHAENEMGVAARNAEHGIILGKAAYLRNRSRKCKGY